MCCISLYCIELYCIVLYCHILQLVLIGMDKLARMDEYENIKVSYLVGGKAAAPEEGRKGNIIKDISQVVAGEFPLL